MCMVSTLNESSSIPHPESKAASGHNYHHGNLRAALIHSGLATLEATQSTEFSLRELTRMIGVSVNAAYRHFTNKDELLSALAIHGFQQLLTRQAEAVHDHTSPRDKFLAAGRAYIDFARQQPALFRLMFGRFATTHRSEALNDSAELAYQGMRYSTALMLGLSIEDDKVIARAMQAWSVIHGLSHLIIDGQIHLHTQDVDGLIDVILANASS